MDSTTLILGGGWGGLTTAHHLRSLAPSNHRIVVIDRSPTFRLGVSNLKLLTGENTSLAAISRRMENIRASGIELVRATVTRIDPASRSVETDAGHFRCDHLVLALGAELDPHRVPGFVEAAVNLYEAEGALTAHRRLSLLDEGRIAVLVAGTPFRCPAAPYEAAMLIDAWLRARSRRQDVAIDLFTPESIPMAVAGSKVGEALKSFLADRSITAHFDHQVSRIDSDANTLHFGDEDGVPYDLLIGIPPHRAPGVVVEASLTDSTGYIPVHPQTLELLSDLETLAVHLPGVYAIGDLVSIRLLNGALLPKAGIFAEGEGRTVAARIAAQLEAGSRPPAYDGKGFCYVDVGRGLAAYGEGDFFAYPAPRVVLHEPSHEGRRAKEEYEDLLDTWFAA